MQDIGLRYKMVTKKAAGVFLPRQILFFERGWSFYNQPFFFKHGSSFASRDIDKLIMADSAGNWQGVREFYKIENCNENKALLIKLEGTSLVR